MRDHDRTRVWALRPRRINDDIYSYTFFSSICLIRGYKCFQLFEFKYSKVYKIHSIRIEANVPDAYEDTIRTIGAPNKTVTDNIKVFTGIKWTSIHRKYCIESRVTIPHHQHQNYSKDEGVNIEFSIFKLYHHTPHSPLTYWCFAVSFLDKTRRFLSQSTLDGKCGLEMIKGETADISIFRFSWFQSVWYYSSLVSFPKNNRGHGSILDLIHNTGDRFSYERFPVFSFKDISLRRDSIP